MIPPNHNLQRTIRQYTNAHEDAEEHEQRAEPPKYTADDLTQSVVKFFVLFVTLTHVVPLRI